MHIGNGKIEKLACKVHFLQLFHFTVPIGQDEAMFPLLFL